ncbi:hypothetical protein BDW75DRAFT_244529 [Aspergillus navahoensis]
MRLIYTGGVWMTFLSLASARQYCARAFHSVSINNNTLYIDGGELRYYGDRSSDNPGGYVFEPMHDIQTVDLSKPWSNTDDWSNLYGTIYKPVYTESDLTRPTYLNEGASWSDGSNLYFYGGYRSLCTDCDTPETVPPVATWKYDIAGNEWNKDGFEGTLLHRLCEGGIAKSKKYNVAYFLGGVLIAEGDPSVSQSVGRSWTGMVSGLLTLDMDAQRWSNLSTLGMNNWATISEGYVNIIESVGDRGILVAFGGFTYPIGLEISRLATAQNDAKNHNSMEYILLYDIARERWYTQKSSGDIPSWRMSGCSVVVPAQDQSSFSIYVFGGMGYKTADSDGDVYVLSIPSFHWIRVNSDNKKIWIKHKCQLVAGHTLLSVGGTVPTDDSEYDPTKENCASGDFTNGLALFNLNNHTWHGNYDPSDRDEYAIHSSITKVIGGNSTGGATVIEPESKFNGTDVASMFEAARKKATVSLFPSSDPFSSSSSSASESAPESARGFSKRAIAGIVVGVIAAIAIIGTVTFYVKRHRHGPTNHKNPKHVVFRDGFGPAELYGDQGQLGPAELHGKHRPPELDGEFQRV